MRMAGHSTAAGVNKSRAASWDKGGLMASQLCKQTAVHDPPAFECGLKSSASVFMERSLCQVKELQLRQYLIKLPTF